MRFLLKISVWFLSLGIALSVNGQQISQPGTLYLFTDRNFCLSGDSVWFRVIFPHQAGLKSNIIHVQMSTPDGRVITSAMKKKNAGMSEGFLPVTDSLKTGVYLLKACVLPCLPGTGASSVLFVYNRFDREITRINVPQGEVITPSVDFLSKISIETDRQVYHTRDTVRVKVHFRDIRDSLLVIAGAVLSDPLASRFSGFKISESSGSVERRNQAEEDGFFIHGKASAGSFGEPFSRALVLLSIQGQYPYFDYFLTDQSGNFSFFLKNAFGNGKALIQAYSEDRRELSVELNGNSEQETEKMETAIRSLSSGESEFAGNIIQSDYFRRLFGSGFKYAEDTFILPQRYPIPFFGIPDLVVKTADFINLPDFTEISRELLPGVKYRIKDGNPVIRMVNAQMNDFFDEEPLKLINGVPVFSNNFISQLKSSDIESISCVVRERVFGDLVFKGVLSFKLKEGNNAWLSDLPGTWQFSIRGLQTDKKPAYMESPGRLAENQPDLRNVFYWSASESRSDKVFTFRTSDLKGEIAITVRGITPENKPFVAEKKIRVQ